MVPRVGCSLAINQSIGPSRPQAASPILSPREKRLLRRMARGCSDLAIAREIGGRKNQIGEQRKRLLHKLQSSSQLEIAEAAARWAFWPSYNLTKAADELIPWPKHRQDGGDKPPP